MTIVFPFHAGDVLKTKRLITWIQKIEGCKNHDALLVADAGLSWGPVFELRDLAETCFKSVSLISNSTSVSGWPAGPNSLFYTASLHISKNSKDPWFWCESDCIPLKPMWADMLQATYETCGKPYMGALVPCNKPGLPAKHLNGNAVYPASAFDIMGRYCSGTKAFDIASAEAVIQHAADTFRVQHFWGQKDLAPTFAEKKTETSPVNTFTLDTLKEGAVVFHRNKDLSLITLLWKKLYPLSVGHESFLLVLPFCKKDSSLAAKNVAWMEALQPQGYNCDVLLSYDTKTPNNHVKEIEGICNRIFKQTILFQYPAPRFEGWPAGPNHAFQATANYVYHSVKRPWFWMEADMVPLKRDWLDTLQNEYWLCGKPFMGSIVKSLGHMNGSGIYPENFPELCPNAMKATTVAWDWVMKPDMILKTHDASRLMQHWWGMNKGQPHVNLGQAPSFRDRNNMKWIEADAVTLHRCKDGSLIDVLRNQLPQK